MFEGNDAKGLAERVGFEPTTRIAKVPYINNLAYVYGVDYGLD